MSPEETAILTSIRRKNGLAFENFYKEQYTFLLLSAYKYLGDTGLAQEVVNDVFIKLWEDATILDIQTSLKFYIHRAVVNRSLNILDKQKRERQHQKAMSHTTPESIEWKEMEDNELKIKLYKAIEQLPEQCRKVFMMSRFEELKQQEIADKMGISIKTVKNHITRALQQLNEVLGDWNTIPIWIVAVQYFFWV
jgi:RNA polymerase sigma-70 factor (family 1)